MTPANGTLLDKSIYSRALCKYMRMHVYLPPHYAEFSLRYPVLYLLHPWGEDEQFWTRTLELHKTADHLIKAGAIPPFIAVMPQGDKSFFINADDPGGDFSLITRFDPDYYQDALNGYGDYADYLLEDVLPETERCYRAKANRADRVIAGLAMGGTGAAVLAFTQPGIFGAVGIHSPHLFTAERLGPPWVFGFGDAQAFAERDPVQLAHGLTRQRSPRIYLDCSNGDETGSSGAAADLHYALAGENIPHTYIVQNGPPTPAAWQANLAAYLGFYAAGWTA